MVESNLDPIMDFLYSKIASMTFSASKKELVYSNLPPETFLRKVESELSFRLASFIEKNSPTEVVVNDNQYSDDIKYTKSLCILTKENVRELVTIIEKIISEQRVEENLSKFEKLVRW